MKVNYDDKVGTVPKNTHTNEWWDDDANEVKQAINTNWVEGLKAGSGVFAGYFFDTRGADRTNWLSGDIMYGKGGLYNGDFVIVEVKDNAPTAEANFYKPYVRASRE